MKKEEVATLEKWAKGTDLLREGGICVSADIKGEA